MSENDDISPKRFEGNYSGEIELEYLPCINYAMVHNHIAVFKFCKINNLDEKDWKMVKLSIDGEYIKHDEVLIEMIQAGQTLQINSMKITVDVKKFD
jgi:hypothetical protein